MIQLEKTIDRLIKNAVDRKSSYDSILEACKKDKLLYAHGLIIEGRDKVIRNYRKLINFLNLYIEYSNDPNYKGGDTRFYSYKH